MSSLKYIKAVLKYEDTQWCIEIEAISKAKVKGVVSSVYTFDDWKTVRNKSGSFAGVKENDHVYRICIPTNSTISNAKMWFCIKLAIYGPSNNLVEEIWDNNNGWNYEIHTEKLPKICLPSPPPKSATINTNNTNIIPPKNNVVNTNHTTVSSHPTPPQIPPLPSDIFIIKLDKSITNNIITSTTTNNYNLSNNAQHKNPPINNTNQFLPAGKIDYNMPLIRFTTKKYLYPLPPLLQQDKPPEIMRSVYYRYVF